MIDLLVVDLKAGVDGCLCDCAAVSGQLSGPAHHLAVWLRSSEYHGLAHSTDHVARTQRQTHV